MIVKWLQYEISLQNLTYKIVNEVLHDKNIITVR